MYILIVLKEDDEIQCPHPIPILGISFKVFKAMFEPEKKTNLVIHITEYDTATTEK